MDTARIFRSKAFPTPIGRGPVVDALRHAAFDPDRPALVDGASGERLTRGELAARSAGLAAVLMAQGVGRGDMVAIAMPNTVWWPVMALAVWRAGAALAPLSPLWSAEELARALARVCPRLAIATAPLDGLVREALSRARIPADVVVVRGDADVPPTPAGCDPFAEPRLDPVDLALVPFSSGTGGLPKGVRITHGNLAATAAQIAASFGSVGRYDSSSVTLAGAPFYHALGMGASLCAPLSVGAQIVTVPIPRTPQVLELIARHRATYAVVPLFVFEDIARGRLEPAPCDLQFITTAGAHLPASVEERVGKRLGCLARSGYGMTEATTMISASIGGPNDPGTVGWLAPHTEARLVDPETGRDAPPDQPGELWIRGPQVMDGYYDDPTATAETLTGEGWLKTGDLVIIRDDGQLVIRDRLKELIKVEGRSVAPAEIELVLRDHPSVRDAAVVGRPHPERGEVPVAHVVLGAPATAEELLAFVAPRLAGYKALHDVQFVDELPRLPSGKLARNRLRDRERAAA